MKLASKLGLLLGELFIGFAIFMVYKDPQTSYGAYGLGIIGLFTISLALKGKSFKKILKSDASSLYPEWYFNLVKIFTLFFALAVIIPLLVVLLNGIFCGTYTFGTSCIL